MRTNKKLLNGLLCAGALAAAGGCFWNIAKKKAAEKDENGLSLKPRVIDTPEHFYDDDVFLRPIESIYGEHTRITASDDDRHGMNNNALIVGAPHSGKTTSVALSNIMQMNASYVVSDPSGELLRLTGKMLEDNGYSVRVFNLTDASHSNGYNPFRYIREEGDVLKLVECFINSTTETGRNTDKFWLDAEKGLLCAIIFYLREYETSDKQNFAGIAKMVRQAKSDNTETQRKNAQAKKTELDKIFDYIRGNIDKDDICLKYYDVFKLAPDKTTSGILVSLDGRLAVFSDIPDILISEDELNLETFGDDKNVLFVTVPPKYSFFSTALYRQIFDTLCYVCEFNKMRLMANVRFILDDFTTIGKIPNFALTLNTLRKSGISCMIFVESLEQLRQLYGNTWYPNCTEILDACATTVYLGKQDVLMQDGAIKKVPDGFVLIVTRDYATRGRKSFCDKKFDPFTMHKNNDKLQNHETKKKE